MAFVVYILGYFAVICSLIFERLFAECPQSRPEIWEGNLARFAAESRKWRTGGACAVVFVAKGRFIPFFAFETHDLWIFRFLWCQA
jgi:hypothetical protein